nr:transporter substrate-binding domain-containing protein [uncultured Pseudodesulfovibrio sp.]
MKKTKNRPIVSFCLTFMTILFLFSNAKAQQPFKLVCDIWPPYQVETVNGLSGFSVEMVQAIYNQMGIPTDNIRAFPWRRAMEMIKHGDAEALFSANFTADRQAFAHYSSEILFESSWVIWTRRGEEIHSLESLKGKKIGVVSGYSYTREFWNFIKTNCIVENVNSDKANFKKLSAGRIDATVAEYSNGLHLAATLKYKNITPNRAVTIKRDGLYIIFSRKRVTEEFVKAFSNALIKFKKTEVYSQLRDKYFPQRP